ncbi:putative BAG family molecular chaperone regulator/7/8 [Helianthus annuus]|nr:putative BAG family molecular chaperone regulator/7/8 [Helianthus annuus]KAJ0750454.1 putative BAG family molecular chaperone regulator/7/8 [Helianthus annuus]
MLLNYKFQANDLKSLIDVNCCLQKQDANIQVRVAKRQMVDELEAMQEVVNPHPGRDESLSLRTFDIRDGVTQKKMGARVAQVIRMLEYADGSETFG